MTTKEIKETITEQNDQALFCDGFDEALIGVANRYGMLPVAAYNYDKYIKLLQKGGIKDYSEAEEYFSFNVIGAWVGESTPVFVTNLRRKSSF